jgi:GDP-L-fucose synthase
MARDNTVMNVNLLDACYRNGVKKVVWLASTTGYPEGDHAMKEEEMFVGDPFSKYFAVGWMKRYTEKLCELYSTKVPNPMSCVVLRPSNIYGPNDKIDPKHSHVLASLIRKTIEEQNPVEIWGDGQDVRDVLYVDDMVDAMILAAEKVDGFDQFNIGYGEAYSVLDLLDKIQSVAKKSVPYKLVPSSPQMIPVRRIDISKAEKVLGWTPKTKIDDGIRKTYEWMKRELGKEQGITGMYD